MNPTRLTLTVARHALKRDTDAIDQIAATAHDLAPRSAAGDEQRLRNIPALGPGCPGAIPGTRPDHAITRRKKTHR